MPEHRAGGVGESTRRLYYAAGGKVIAADISDPALLESARCLFPAYEVPQPSSSDSAQIDLSIESHGGGYVLSASQADAVVCQTSMDAIVAFEFALSRALTASLSNYMHLHASGTVVDGQAVLALGGSGAGKSSLAVSMLSKGYPTLGDETVLLSPEGRAAPFKRLVKATPEVLGTAGIDPASTVHWDPAWPEAWYEPENGVGWAGDSPVAVIAVVLFDPSKPLRLIPISKAEGLNFLIHSIMTTGVRARESFHTLVGVVEGASLYRLEYRSAVEAAEVLCSLVK